VARTHKVWFGHRLNGGRTQTGPGSTVLQGCNWIYFCKSFGLYKHKPEAEGGVRPTMGGHEPIPLVNDRAP
jgi:hypothetical protein